MPHKHPNAKPKTSSRNTRILQLRQKGMSLSDIARSVGLTRQGVTKIVRKAETAQPAACKNEKEQLLDRLFTLSANDLVAKLERGEISNGNSLLSICEKSFDRLQSIQTAPAQNLLGQLFGSVHADMVAITIGTSPNTPKTATPRTVDVEPTSRNR